MANHQIIKEPIMAFDNKTKSTNKNLFVARLVSVKSGKTISWINITEEFARKVFGVELKLVTAEEALSVLPSLLGNDNVTVEVTDLTADIEVVDATEF